MRRRAYPLFLLVVLAAAVIFAVVSHSGEAANPGSVRHEYGIEQRQFTQALERAKAQRAKERAYHSLVATGDWRTAVRVTQRVYPGTEAWLLSCSSGEGGHGGFVMNHEGSGAGGPMQFMQSTFYSYVDAAIRDTRNKGFRFPAVARSWYHPLGQAVTAAYMRTHGQSGHWDPGIDPLCR